MKRKFLFMIFIIINFITSTFLIAKNNVVIDELSESKMQEIFNIKKINYEKSMSDKIDLISSEFLGIEYFANRLVGSLDKEEELVIDLLKLDCFTYLDYIETFRRANTKEEFINQLKKVRYIDGEVEYLKRKHFFSDWVYENTKIGYDLVEKDKTFQNYKSVDLVKINQGKNGVYIPSLEVKERNINYIPRENINDINLSNLVTGDYIGFRRNIDGLDVTHVGLIIKKDDGIYVRHASSSKSVYKVVDQKLTDYIEINTGVKGILLFRSNISQINVEYIDIYGNKLKDSVNIIKNIGEEYNIEILDIPAYVYKTSEGNLKGIVDKNDINIKVIYYPEFIKNIIK